MSYYNDLNNRVIYLDNEIDRDTVTPIIRMIVAWNRDDKDLLHDNRRPIKIVINSYGGDIDATLSLIDIINVGHLAVTIPKICGRAFFLNYQSFQTYALSRSGLISKISIKLKEYNPTKTAFVFASKAEMNEYVSAYGAIDANVYGVSEEIVSNGSEHIII